MPSGAGDCGDRGHHEDAWLVARRADAILCVVCDGMGAGTSGHRAAALTISILKEAFEAGASPGEVVAALDDANRAIVRRAEASKRHEPEWLGWEGLGTTAEVALFLPGRVHIAHVGDGCIYRFRRRSLEPITTSHTLVNDYRRHRLEASEAELASVPKDIIVRAFGMALDMDVDRHEVETTRGDVWLLCSDGLTNLVSDEVIASVLDRGGPSSAMSRALIDAALAASGPSGEPCDNITVVVNVIE